MFGIGVPELAIVAVILLLLFGSRLPSVMRNLGRGVTEFKKGVNSNYDDDDAEAVGNEKKEHIEEKQA